MTNPHPPRVRSPLRWARRCSHRRRCAMAQPTWGVGNPSPTAGSATSQKANASADQALYKPVEYTNVNKKGPALVVIPGEIKSNNATFLQKFTANNIADFGEIELSAANFQVLERSNLGPVLNEFALAYNLGDPDAARKFLKMGKLKSTKYVVKFDILKTEQVAAAQSGLRRPRDRQHGRPAGRVRRLARRRAGRHGRRRRQSARCTPASRAACGSSACATRSSTPRPPSRWRRATPRRRWKWAPSPRRCSAFPNRSKAASRSTRWSSAWSRSRSGKSTTSTNDPPAAPARAPRAGGQAR